MSLNSLSIALKASLGIIDASISIRESPPGYSAYDDEDEMLQVLVSKTGTGSLNKLWTGTPCLNKIDAIPVQAQEATYFPLERNNDINVYIIW